MSGRDTVQVDSRQNRPRLYLGLVLWGPRFRDHFERYLLASLLTDGNLSASFSGTKHLLVCCPAEDWEQLTLSNEINRVREIAEVEWEEFEPDRAAPIRSMSRAHGLLISRAKSDSAYLTMLSPELACSRNFVPQIVSWIAEGHELVLVPALRGDEELILPKLARYRTVDGAIDIDAVALNGMLIGSFHSEIRTSDVDSMFLDTCPNNFHLSAPDGSWFVSRNLAWFPLLMDLRRARADSGDVVGGSVIDSFAFSEIFPRDMRIHWVNGDSEIAIASWGPAGWSSRSMVPQKLQMLGPTKRLFNDLVMRHTAKFYVFWENRYYDWIKVVGMQRVVVIGAKPETCSAIGAAEARLSEALEKTCSDILMDASPSAYQKRLDQWVWLVPLYARFRNSIVVAKGRLNVAMDVVLGRGNARDRVVRKVTRILRLKAIS